MGKRLKVFWQKLDLRAISTRPRYESYMWGRRRSLFAYVVYHVVFLLRYLSPLQLLKVVLRAASASAENDRKERADFHALHTELYLLAVMLFAGLAAYLGYIDRAWLPCPVWLLLLLLLVESLIWTFYYMLFRVLIEKHLTIFNEAEYFLSLPVVLLSQVLLVTALIDGATVSGVATAIFGIAGDGEGLDDSLRMALGILGYSYTALIIANVVNLIPPIPVWQRHNITVIGAGDVVRERILKVAHSNLYKPQQLAVASDYISSEFKSELEALGIEYKAMRDSALSGCASDAEREGVANDIVSFVKKRSSYAIIATPPDTHLPLMAGLAKEGIYFAVEKPIVVTPAELVHLEDGDNPMMQHGFLLSYYWLEKALGLNYFLSLNPVFRKYLDIYREGGRQQHLSASALYHLRQRLGKPEHIDIDMMEKEDSRSWALRADTGGFYLETFIHPMTLLLNVAGLGETVTLDKVRCCLASEALAAHSESKQELAASFIHLVGQAGNCSFDIRAGKYMPSKRRAMKVRYTCGQLLLDLDARVCRIVTDEGDVVVLSVKSLEGEQEADYGQNYGVQMSLFDRFIQDSGRWIGARYDDYPAQLQVLQRMFDLLEDSPLRDNYYCPESASQSEIANIAAREKASAS